MNNSSKNKDVAFAILISLVLTIALWFTVGQWITYSMCQSTPNVECTSRVGSAVNIILLAIGGLLLAWNVARVLRK